LTAYLSRSRLRAGLDTDGKGFFVNIKVPDKGLSHRHLVVRSLDVVRAVGADTDNKYTGVYITDNDHLYSQRLIEEITSGQTGLIIGINPGGNPASPTTKCWPGERFATVADNLAQKYSARIVITGSPSEIALAEKMASLMKVKPFIAAGRTTVKQLAALLKRCHLFISNDTGPMHIAVAMGTPTIGIFGAGFWPALGNYPPETNFIMVRHEVNCWPCYKLHCYQPRCLEGITVDTVLKAAETQIETVEKPFNGLILSP
ncbi:MAG: glycosyltransferase family 9 protein, partial [Planctomycetota bacterium]|nr:glycosyltransferase family 9 protein [Planctomycetota bacterium]